MNPEQTTEYSSSIDDNAKSKINSVWKPHSLFKFHHHQQQQQQQQENIPNHSKYVCWFDREEFQIENHILAHIFPTEVSHELLDSHHCYALSRHYQNNYYLKQIVNDNDDDDKTMTDIDKLVEEEEIKHKPRRVYTIDGFGIFCSDECKNAYDKLHFGGRHNQQIRCCRMLFKGIPMDAPLGSSPHPEIFLDKYNNNSNNQQQQHQKRFTIAEYRKKFTNNHLALLKSGISCVSWKLESNPTSMIMPHSYPNAPENYRKNVRDMIETVLKSCQLPPLPQQQKNNHNKEEEEEKSLSSSDFKIIPNTSPQQSHVSSAIPSIQRSSTMTSSSSSSNSDVIKSREMLERQKFEKLKARKHRQTMATSFVKKPTTTALNSSKNNANALTSVEMIDENPKQMQFLKSSFEDAFKPTTDDSTTSTTMDEYYNRIRCYNAHNTKKTIKYSMDPVSSFSPSSLTSPQNRNSNYNDNNNTTNTTFSYGNIISLGPNKKCRYAETTPSHAVVGLQELKERAKFVDGATIAARASYPKLATSMSSSRNFNIEDIKSSDQPSNILRRSLMRPFTAYNNSKKYERLKEKKKTETPQLE